MLSFAWVRTCVSIFALGEADVIIRRQLRAVAQPVIDQSPQQSESKGSLLHLRPGAEERNGPYRQGQAELTTLQISA
jgi:hypothetical protein